MTRDSVYPHVTDICNIVSKGDGLLWWAAKVALRDGFAGAWEREREAAADRGTAVHAMLEGKWMGDYELYDEAVNYLADMGLYGFIAGASRALDELNIDVMWSERQFTHDKLRYIGTADHGIAVLGKRYILDVKTQNNLRPNPYPSHWMQIAAYRQAAISMGVEGARGWGGAVLRISHDNYAFDKMPAKILAGQPQGMFNAALALHKALVCFEKEKANA